MAFCAQQTSIFEPPMDLSPSHTRPQATGHTMTTLCLSHITAHHITDVVEYFRCFLVLILHRTCDLMPDLGLAGVQAKCPTDAVSDLQHPVLAK